MIAAVPEGRMIRAAGVDLGGLDLSHANLSKADLHIANLSWASLGGTILFEAIPTGATMPDGTKHA